MSDTLDIIESPELREIQGQLDDRHAKVKAFLDEAGPTLDTAKVKSVDGDTAAKTAYLRGLNDEINDLTKKRDDHLVLLKAAGLSRGYDAELAAAEAGDGRSIPGRTKSLGQMFAESPVRTGGVGTKAEFKVGLKTLFQTSAGWTPQSLRDPGYLAAASAPIMFLDLVPTSPTSQAAIKYMEQTTRTNNAAERAEGGAYGEAAFALTERSVTVETVGVWLPYTDEQLEDVEEAADMIDSELPLMLFQRLDSQGLVGDGVTPNVLGINNKGSIQTQAKGADVTMDAVHKGMTKVRVTGRAFPNAVVFHPNDWQDIRLTRTADGIYILGNPSDPGPDRIWGLRVAQSDNQTENTAVVGDFANYSRLRIRRDVTIEKTNSHDTYFTSGKNAIRAGIRCAFVWRRAAAFCTVTGI